MGADEQSVKPASESFRVFARLRPCAPSEVPSSDLRVINRFGQQCIIQARNLEFVLDWVRRASRPGASLRISAPCCRSLTNPVWLSLRVNFLRAQVWDVADSQQAVYDRGIRERVEHVLSGYNAMVLCYGQTGSGKTHTIFGPDEVLDSATFASSDKAAHGIVPRACTQLFEGMANADSDVTFVVHVSYLEAYNGQLRDLLGKGGRKDNLIARESAATGVVIEGLSHTSVSSPGEVMRAVMRGNTNRAVAAMKMNERSSRGHGVITIHVREVRGEGSERAGKLTIVDLAGMESTKKSPTVEGASSAAERQEEVKAINQSLWALGTVIHTLLAQRSRFSPPPAPRAFPRPDAVAHSALHTPPQGSPLTSPSLHAPARAPRR
jgi:hypothetical protein